MAPAADDPSAHGRGDASAVAAAATFSSGDGEQHVDSNSPGDGAPCQTAPNDSKDVEADKDRVLVMPAIDLIDKGLTYVAMFSLLVNRNDVFLLLKTFHPHSSFRRMLDSAYSRVGSKVQEQVHPVHYQPYCIFFSSALWFVFSSPRDQVQHVQDLAAQGQLQSALTTSAIGLGDLIMTIMQLKKKNMMMTIMGMVVVVAMMMMKKKASTIIMVTSKHVSPSSQKHHHFQHYHLHHLHLHHLHPHHHHYQHHLCYYRDLGDLFSPIK
jgi:hypothetical protein